MTDEKCGYHHEGYCLKGLPGTPCEVRGCVAHTTSPSEGCITKLGVIDAVFDMAVWLAENGYLWKSGEFRNIKENKEG